MGGVDENWISMYTHIDAYLRHCRAQGLSADTTLRERRYLLERLFRAFGDLHVVTAAQVEAFLDCPNWTAQTKAVYWVGLNGYYRWAVRTGRVTLNPMALTDRPRVPYRAPEGTSAAVFRRIVRDAVEPCLTAALLAGFAGLRCFEIARADRDDVDPEWIRVCGKGGRVDEIPTHQRIWAHLRGRGPGPLVRDTHGRHYRPNTLSTIFALHMRRDLGLDITLHRLRHHFADQLRQSRLADGRTVDMETVRVLLRHRSLATTQRYLCTRDGERRLAIDALPVPR